MRGKKQTRSRRLDGDRLDPIALEVFRGLFVSICEEMGLSLMRSASSPNIKERRDYSCALFDGEGRTIAQGDHMPVHLGSMPASVAAVLAALPLGPGDVAIVNDPFHGGSHLPDITLVSAVFAGGDRPSFHVACRAHHSDVGGMQAGSMPLATEILQEGLVLPPLPLVRAGRTDRVLLETILANVRTPREREEDLAAQRAALRTGERRLHGMVERYGRKLVERAGGALREYSKLMMHRTLEDLPAGLYRFEDRLDDDGFGSGPIPIRAEIALRGRRAHIDLRGCADQVRGGVNAVRAITVSAVIYVFRCLIQEDVPSNEGLAAPLTVLTRPGSIVDALPPAAVAAGNVETSQRIVDVLLGALAQAIPGRIPAASQGTMNNLALGGRVDGVVRDQHGDRIDADRVGQVERRGEPIGGSMSLSGGHSRGREWSEHNAQPARPFAYYETIAGGMGARPGKNGLSGVHTHMTNSLNTPIEALESALPLRIVSYTLRRGTGGEGRHHGGDGVRRTIEALVPTTFSILSDRRTFAPYGLRGGQAGAPGRNGLQRAGERSIASLPSKVSGSLDPGDRLVIETPGGGGWGQGIPARTKTSEPKARPGRRRSRVKGRGGLRKP